MPPAFNRLVAAEAISNFGAMLSRLAIPWLAALALDVTPFQMGFLVVADVIAGGVGSLLLGVLVDRAEKRAVMVATDIARAAILAALALLAVRSSLTFAALVVAAAASGFLTMAFELARSAWIAQNVEESALAAGNSRMSIATSVSETAAFALGGWVYQALGAVLALAVDAASYLASALLARSVPRAPAVRAEAAFAMSAVFAEARDGLAALAATATLRRLAAIEALVALAMSLAGTSYMIYVARDLGFSTGVLGMIFATGGLGALAGAALAPRWVQGQEWRALRFGLLLLALGFLFIPLAAAATVAGAALLVAHQVIGDGGHTLYSVHDRTLRQRVATPALRARIDAGIRALGQLATLAGALGGGALATAIGTRPALFLAAAILAAAVLVALREVHV